MNQGIEYVRRTDTDGKREKYNNPSLLWYNKARFKKLVASSFYQFCVLMHSFQLTNCCLALFEKGIAGTNLQVESFSCSEQIITSAFHSAYSTGRSVLHESY